MLRTTAAFFVGLLFPAFSAGQPLGSAAFHLGEPVYLEFRYDGDNLHWDGHIGVGTQDGEPRLTISNGAFFVVTRGRQDFVPGRPDSNGHIPRWKTFSAKHGELVPPIGNRVSRPWYTVQMVGAFRTILNLADFYQIDEPGVYNVHWGMKIFWDGEIVFTVLPADALSGTEMDQ